MKVVYPVKITPELVASENIDEVYPDWSAGATYSKFDRVVYLERIYESQINNNLGNNPVTDVVNWIDVGPSNERAMFDDSYATQTTGTANITFTVKAKYVNTIYLGNMTGISQAKVIVRNGLSGDIVYQDTRSLYGGENVINWYSYFFTDPNVLKSSELFENIPPYLNSHITVELTGAADIAIGQAIFGTVEDLGCTSYGASAGIIDYSVKEIDQFGAANLVKRNFSKRMSGQFIVEKGSVNRVYSKLASLRSTPALYIGDSDKAYSEPMVIFGFYRDFSVVIEYPEYSLCNLEIEGLA